MQHFRIQFYKCTNMKKGLFCSHFPTQRNRVLKNGADFYFLQMHLHLYPLYTCTSVGVCQATVVFLSLDLSFYLIWYNHKSEWSAREGRWQLSEAQRETEHIVLVLK